MKKVKLMALGLMVMMIQSVGAVTLPSTSYSPYAGGSSYGGAESSALTGGTLISGSYSMLGSGAVAACNSEETARSGGFEGCEDCCVSYTPNFITCVDACTTDDCIDECASTTGYKNCVNSCEQGGSLPLDGGLSIMLVLALGSGAVRMFRKKQN